MEEEATTVPSLSHKRGVEELSETKRNKTDIPLNPPILFDKPTYNQVIKELISRLIDTSTDHNNVLLIVYFT